MNLKKIVSVIVAGLALCLMFNFPSEAATIKATTKAKTVSKKTEKTVTKKRASKKKSKSKKKEEYTASELRYMTTIIYCEARGESYAGKKAVGIVVMNRVRSKKFPNSVKKVIYQRGQFSPVRNGSLNRALSIYDKQMKKGKLKGDMKTCSKVAKEVLKGSTIIEVKGKKEADEELSLFLALCSRCKVSIRRPPI